MNASTSPANLAPELSGKLLGTYFHTDTLQLDLYGSEPDQWNETHQVESVTLHGHTVDICELFTRSQLHNMGTWLTFKADANPTLRSVAADAKHAAMQGPWERQRVAG